MRAAAIVALLVVLAVGSAFAVAPIRPPTQALCASSDDYNWEDYSAYYKSNATAVTKMCMFDAYEDACPTLDGLVACDKTVARCVDWKADAYWRAQANAANWNHADKPQECLRYGGNMFLPDQAVLAVVQPLFSSLTFIALIVIVVLSLKANVLAMVLFVIMAIVAIVQTVGYYYLNAYVLLAAVMISATCYSMKSNAAVGLGMLVSLFAFFWVTYESGLGAMQHHARRGAGPAMRDSFENACNSYYSGYFSSPFVQKDLTNPQEQFWGFCTRGAVAGQLFVMFFQQLLLMAVIVAGAFSVTSSDNKDAPEENTAAPVSEDAPIQ